MLLCIYEYDPECGNNVYKIVKCDCGEIEVVTKNDELICKNCGRKRAN